MMVVKGVCRKGSLVICVANFLAFCCCDVSTSSNFNKFQSALQQQNIHTILGSIEERLRNLDNIYSMQLSQSIDVKLDQYNRKLENVDSKIMRLEALVMLNLGKISENISTKNFKDDIEKTNIYRKLDSIYENVVHRLNYIERQYEANFDKMQKNSEITMKRLEKIEESISKSNSDFEAELSDAIFAIDDLKTTYTSMEKKILNTTEAALNVSRDSFNLLSKSNIENRKSMNKLHDNIIGNLQYIDNKTSEHIKISDNTNGMLKQMQVELKEDFNSYANKVADMNTDIWKTSDTTEDDLKTIAKVVNATKIELQNGVRSLMLQLGKLSHKENSIPLGTDRYDELETKWNANFEKILTNQDVFMESCHRLQMDESQIESEISVMLNKLIDMLEKKFASETKDMKNFEKALKNHDGRTNRNLFQANQNIISLFEKSTVNTQIVTNEIRKVGTDLDTLFSFVQSTLTDSSSAANTKEMKKILDKLNQIESNATGPRTNNGNVTNHDIHKEIHRLSKEISSMIDEINNNTLNTCVHKNEVLKIIEVIMKNNSNENRSTSLGSKQNVTEGITDEIKHGVMRVFGPPPRLEKNQNQTTANIPKKQKCKQLRDMIDIRAGTVQICEEENKKPKRKKKKYDIDIRSESDSNEYDSEIDYLESTTENVDTIKDSTNEEIFTTHVYTTTTTDDPFHENIENKTEPKQTNTSRTF
ncbi:unnamed protein product [Phaedon cochleariae]|uniref:Viral A-type inclusion protein n=1 Tax=Phaedon cochleariae TaxID=80249 RepID=A0A9N9X0T4_PHACE|nr:unnamed protein product [Phaedon cochleariae]